MTDDTPTRDAPPPTLTEMLDELEQLNPAEARRLRTLESRRSPQPGLELLGRWARDRHGRAVPDGAQDRDRALPRGTAGGQAGGSTALALSLGVARRQVQRWAHRGLTVAQADVAAVALGLHPAEIWPGWWKL